MEEPKDVKKIASPYSPCFEGTDKDAKEYHIVWNEDKTQGVIFADKQLAYEARKGSDTNCFTEDGERSLIAVAFCEQTADENATIQTVKL